MARREVGAPPLQSGVLAQGECLRLATEDIVVRPVFCAIWHRQNIETTTVRQLEGRLVWLEAAQR